MGNTTGADMFSGLSTGELRTLGGMLASGGRAAGNGPCPDYGTATEILNISADVHNEARHRAQATAQAEAEPGIGQ